MSPLYLDDEFSCFDAPKLVSLGLVDDEGRELYLEVSAMPDSMRAFVEDTVVPQLGLMPTAMDSVASLGERLGQWLLSFLSPESRVEVRYDFATDFEMLEHALRAAGLWAQHEFRLVPTHIGYCIGEPEAEHASELSWATSFATDGIARHRALADARALRAAFHATHIDQTRSWSNVAPTPTPTLTSRWFDRTVQRILKGVPP